MLRKAIEYKQWWIVQGPSVARAWVVSTSRSPPTLSKSLPCAKRVRPNLRAHHMTWYRGLKYVCILQEQVTCRKHLDPSTKLLPWLPWNSTLLSPPSLMLHVSSTSTQVEAVRTHSIYFYMYLQRQRTRGTSASAKHKWSLPLHKRLPN